MLIELNERLSTRLFDDFAGPSNWEVYSDVVPTLAKIKQAGAMLGVISNFDERLGSLLIKLCVMRVYCVSMQRAS